MANAINSLNFGGNTYTFTLPYGVCSTASDVAEKVVTVPNFSVENGARILVRFDNTNTSQYPTLNVNGSGAIPIALGDMTDFTSNNIHIDANRSYEFVLNITETDSSLRTTWDLLYVDEKAAPFVVTISGTGPRNYAADKTRDEVYAAYLENKRVIAVVTADDGDYDCYVYVLATASVDECVYVNATYAAGTICWDYFRDAGSRISHGMFYSLMKEGGTMTGALTLSGDPTENLHAATKQYVDSVQADSKNEMLDIAADVFVKGNSIIVDASTTTGFVSIAHENNLFVGILSDATVVYSSDGINWTALEEFEGDSAYRDYSAFSTVKFLNGEFVIVDSGYGIHCSTDGINWTCYECTNIADVTYGNGIYVAATAGTVFYSSDKLTWTQVPVLSELSTIEQILRSIDYFDGFGFVYSSKHGAICYSHDGVTWHDVIAPYELTSAGCSNIVRDNSGKFYMFRFSDELVVSEDGITWSVVEHGIPGLGTSHALNYVDGRIICIVNSEDRSPLLVFSDDGSKWRTRKVGDDIRMWSFSRNEDNNTCVGSTVYVCCANKGVAAAPDIFSFDVNDLDNYIINAETIGAATEQYADSRVFTAVYGTTTLEEVKAAYNSGATVLCTRSDNSVKYILTGLSDTTAYFMGTGTSSQILYRVYLDTTWHAASFTCASASHTHSEYAPAYTYGTEDLTAGSSALETGKLYFVYE